MPMLDEAEFAAVSTLYLGGGSSLKDVRRENPDLSGTDLIHALHEPMRNAYEQITGMYETNENAIMHHRIALYGPDCTQCGKPLRTPRASFCAACGAKRE